MAARHGTSLLRLLLTYKDATKLELNPEEPGTASILVPDKKGQVSPKLFENCSWVVENPDRLSARVRA